MFDLLFGIHNGTRIPHPSRWTDEEEADQDDHSESDGHGRPAGISEERTDPNDLFVHSTIFVVVDGEGRLRGAFESVGEHVSWLDAKEAILRAVHELEEEL